MWGPMCGFIKLNDTNYFRYAFTVMSFISVYAITWYLLEEGTSSTVEDEIINNGTTFDQLEVTNSNTSYEYHGVTPEDASAFMVRI